MKGELWERPEAGFATREAAMIEPAALLRVCDHGNARERATIALVSHLPEPIDSLNGEGRFALLYVVDDATGSYRTWPLTRTDAMQLIAGLAQIRDAQDAFFAPRGEDAPF